MVSRGSPRSARVSLGRLGGFPGASPPGTELPRRGAGEAGPPAAPLGFAPQLLGHRPPSAGTGGGGGGRRGREGTTGTPPHLRPGLPH